jgi:FMN reductase
VGIVTGNSQLVTVVVGNPKPGSRTLHAATALADALTASVWAESADGAATRAEIVDLATIADGLLAPWRLSPAGSAAAQTAQSSALLIVATPTYKASYTGLLKLFLDVFPAGSLTRTVVVPLVTSGGEAHRYLADIHLRPVLSELGAVVPAPSLLLTEPEIGGYLDAARSHAHQYGPLIAAAVSAVAATSVPIRGR